MSDLAQRLVAHPRWRWQPGMLARWVMNVAGYDYELAAGSADRVMEARPDLLFVAVHPEGMSRRVIELWPKRAVPDLTEPATAGWLHSMLVEAWREGAPELRAIDIEQHLANGAFEGDVRVVLLAPVERESVSFHGPCLGEACAAALLWVWDR